MVLMPHSSVDKKNLYFYSRAPYLINYDVNESYRERENKEEEEEENTNRQEKPMKSQFTLTH